MPIIFIVFFIPAIYTVYYAMFHGMNNQFEVLGSKNTRGGMMATVTKIAIFLPR